MVLILINKNKMTTKAQRIRGTTNGVMPLSGS
jgi:hypothetical protein